MTVIKVNKNKSCLKVFWMLYPVIVTYFELIKSLFLYFICLIKNVYHQVYI